MKKSKIFLVGSTLALLGLLFIQINWVLKASRLKEEQFNQLARIVLGRVAEAICLNKEACLKLGECSFDIKEEDCQINIGQSEKVIIDSLLKYYTHFYGIPLNYKFEIIKTTGGQAKLKSKNANYYNQRLEETAEQKDLALVVYFPGKKNFILAETGVMFISSLVLIGLVIAFWIITIKSLQKERLVYKRTIGFLNNMTHEFNTPISAISLASGMLKRNNVIDNKDKIKHYSSIIYDENERLKGQVDKILNMAILEKGELLMDPLPIDVHGVIADAVKSMSLLIQNRNGRINCSLKAIQFIINGDVVHFKNVIYNLLDNADKYSANAPEIFIATRNEKGCIIISICDKGSGIPKNQQKYIFNQFYRVPTGDVHNVKGFGLGLAYVKKVMGELNGKVKLKSELGKGTCFELVLPLLHN